jgi:hypothetical protein
MGKKSSKASRIESVVSIFRAREKENLKPQTKLNEARVELQDRTRYYVWEARRAIGYALLSHMQKERHEYLNWMDSANELLMEAVACREASHQEPWRK